jgi:hypothetical protein
MGGDNIRSARRQRKGRAWLPCREEGKDVPSSPKARLGGETGTNRSMPLRPAPPRCAPRRNATRHGATQRNVSFPWPALGPEVTIPSALPHGPRPPATHFAGGGKMVPGWAGFPISLTGPSLPEVFRRARGGGLRAFL